MRKHPTLAALAGVLLAAQAATTGCGSGAAPFRPDASHPVLFVHGHGGSGTNWGTMANRFRNDGWPASYLDQWNYDSRQSNVATARQLASEVDRLLARTDAAKVDVVTHSMGGLSSRHYAKKLGGAALIDTWVSLGGPNHGTDTAPGCFETSCREMRIGSDFLTALNAGDETPGRTRYATWSSPCDRVINPDSSVSLTGAAATRTSCLSHSGYLTDATVYTQVRDTIDR